ncbi:MAG: DUF3450 domain-containing protein [Chromatiales bacterium]|nr:DUF3450 domain-containing protein [Chromatiales bacterium]
MRPLFYNSILLLSLLFSGSCGPLIAGPLEQSRKAVTSTNAKLKQSQTKIDGLYEETMSLLDQYKTTIQEGDSYETYNGQLSQVVKSQLEELASLDKQIEEIEVTSRSIMPLMGEMIETLENFIAQDLPFLPEERAHRLTNLKDLMIRADISVAQKFRKILEAYQIEIEYGKTLEAYEGMIGEKRVNFLKLGRVAFFYQSLDKSNAGVWNKHQGAWQAVEDWEVKQSITMGMKIARKQHAPELLTVMASKVEAMQ